MKLTEKEKKRKDEEVEKIHAVFEKMYSHGRYSRERERERKKERERRTEF